MTSSAVLKILSAIIVLPVAFVSNALWPKWEKLPLPARIVTGILFLPIVGLAAILSGWWERIDA